MSVIYVAPLRKRCLLYAAFHETDKTLEEPLR